MRKLYAVYCPCHWRCVLSREVKKKRWFKNYWIKWFLSGICVAAAPLPPSTLKLMMDGDENTYPFWMGVSTHFNDVLWIKNSKSYTHYTQRSYACSLKLSYSFKPSLRRWRDFFNDYLFVWCWFSMMILNGQKQNHNDANHAPQHKGSHWYYFCLPYSLYIFQKGTNVVQEKVCSFEWYWMLCSTNNADMNMEFSLLYRLADVPFLRRKLKERSTWYASTHRLCV